jgi:HEAT repeat protein
MFRRELGILCVLLTLLSCSLRAIPQSESAPSTEPANAPPAGPAITDPVSRNSQDPEKAKSPQADQGVQPAVPTSSDRSGASRLKTALTPKQQAWEILTQGCSGKRPSSRASAVRVLGLLPNDSRARRMAENALKDDKPEVRSAAATALGDAKSKISIPKLRDALDDADPAVALSAAHALDVMHDDSGYEVYYEILTGSRKASRGLIASETSILKDPKKLAQLGVEEGIGFIPFAGIGWEAVKMLRKDDSSPIRAAAAKVLARDPDPATFKALSDASGDPKWLVRTAALEALGRRGNATALDTVVLYLGDDNESVRYTAAAAFLRLMSIKGSGHAVKKNPTEQ